MINACLLGLSSSFIKGPASLQLCVAAACIMELKNASDVTFVWA